MLRHELIGTWHLLTLDVEEAPGVNKPWGSDVRGLLIYTPEGHVSMSINKELPVDGTPVEDSCLFYAGTYHLEGKRRITHSVYLSSNPHRRGYEFTREAQLHGDTLTLTGEGELGKSTLTWEKKRP